jgi:hypothetical protein
VLESPVDQTRGTGYPWTVSCCCDPRGCDDFFGRKFARTMAKRYRKRGLDKTAARMVAFLEDAGVEHGTVLEIGGGVGEIQLELLRRGAASAVNLEWRIEGLNRPEPAGTAA